jgi:hypothetical protein
MKLSSIALLLMPMLSKAQTTVEKAGKQEFPKHEIGISWGAFPTSGILVGVHFDMPGSEMTNGRYSMFGGFTFPWFAHRDNREWKSPYITDEESGTSYRLDEYYKMQHYGTLTFNYQYHFTQKHSMGITATWLGRSISNFTTPPDYAGEGSNPYFTITPSNKVIDAKGWDNTFSLCINYRFTYYNKEAISLYTGLHFGFAVKLIEKELLLATEKNNYWTTALQITGFGIEAGKTHAFVTELGFGAQGLIKIGYRYKFNNKE